MSGITEQYLQKGKKTNADETEKRTTHGRLAKTSELSNDRYVYYFRLR